MAMDKFRFEVARRIKGSMSFEKRKGMFDSRITIPCAGKRGWPKLMGVIEEGGRDKYVDVHSVAEAKQKVGFKQMGAEVKSNALDACRYFIQGHRDLLFKTAMESKGSRAAEINFHRLICLRKKVCSEADIAGRGGEDVGED